MRSMRVILRGRLAGPVLVLAAMGATCRSSTPASPSTGTNAVTFTITAAGVVPKTATIDIGDRVLFVNNDTKAHSIVSDPHPDEDDCPNINQVGFLKPADKHETGNFVASRTCGFHDHDAPTDATLTGTITIR